jgi:hypothetical protein
MEGGTCFEYFEIRSAHLDDKGDLCAATRGELGCVGVLGAELGEGFRIRCRLVLRSYLSFKVSNSQNDPCINFKFLSRGSNSAALKIGSSTGTPQLLWITDSPLHK